MHGDRGNVLTVARRATWGGIDVETRAFTAGEPWDPDWADVYFFGGGQDIGQDIVGADLQGPNGDALKRSIAGGAAAFAVCGGLPPPRPEDSSRARPADPAPAVPGFHAPAG